MGLEQLKNRYGNCDMEDGSDIHEEFCLLLQGWENRFLWNACKRFLGAEGERWLKYVNGMVKYRHNGNKQSRPRFNGAVVDCEDALILLKNVLGGPDEEKLAKKLRRAKNAPIRFARKVAKTEAAAAVAEEEVRLELQEVTQLAKNTSGC